MSSEEDGSDGGVGDDGISPISVDVQRHFIPSINSTLIIRQLPSQGLSFQLWPAATTLVNLLDKLRSHPETNPLYPTLSGLTNSSQFRPLNILELGSGTGLVGIAAAATLGAKVTATDLTHVIPNLQFNVEANADVLAANGGCVDVAPLHWGETVNGDGEGDGFLIGREFDLILASDVVYYDDLYEPLIQTLRRFILGDENGKMVFFVMAHLRRWKKDSVFFKKARKFFDVEILHTDPPLPGSRIGVVVYRFSAKLSKKG